MYQCNSTFAHVWAALYFINSQLLFPIMQTPVCIGIIYTANTYERKTVRSRLLLPQNYFCDDRFFKMFLFLRLCVLKIQISKG